MKNRISSGETATESGGSADTHIPAVQLDDNILSDRHCFKQLFERMKVLVMRILVLNMSKLCNCQDLIEWRLPHKYSYESAKKSEMVRCLS